MSSNNDENGNYIAYYNINKGIIGEFMINKDELSKTIQRCFKLLTQITLRHPNLIKRLAENVIAILECSIAINGLNSGEVSCELMKNIEFVKKRIIKKHKKRY